MARQSMRDERTQFLLLFFLFLYLVGRTLQLLADRIPSLFIVFFHVVPPALFALIHGARAYGLRRVIVFTVLCLGVGTFFESVSLRTGFPFGHYYFTDLMGPKIFNLPVLLALAYVGMGYFSWVLAVAILGCQSEPLSGRKTLLLPLTASFIMTAWDLSMDAVWADIDRAWVWRDGGWYYGVPASNFLGWLLTTYIFYQLFALYLRSRAIVASSTNDSRIAICFYALSALGNLLVVAPSSSGGVFWDAAGKSWKISDILWASRLVSIFLMMPVSLIAWTKASPQRRL